MSKLFELEIFKIPEFNAAATPALINTFISNNITSFNKLMELFENSKLEGGALFVCNFDFDNKIVFQHLVLFCKHYKIIMYSLKKGTRHIVENRMSRHYLALVYIGTDDKNYDVVMKMINDNK